jgi:hypothetical protein
MIAFVKHRKAFKDWIWCMELFDSGIFLVLKYHKCRIPVGFGL